MRSWRESKRLSTPYRRALEAVNRRCEIRLPPFAFTRRSGARGRLIRNTRKTVAASGAPPEELASSSIVWRCASAPFALLRNRRVEPGRKGGERRRWAFPSQVLQFIEKRYISPKRGERSEQQGSVLFGG